MVEFRMVDAGELSLRVAVEGSGPLVLMVHGFPESWFSWRHQLGPIAEAGFTAAAIDVRGYGGSDKPGEGAAYDMESLTADVAGAGPAPPPGGPGRPCGPHWGAPPLWDSRRPRPAAG